MKTYTLNNSQTFELQECCSCGTMFLIPQILGNSFRRHKTSFYCPNGHAQTYTESTADKLKRELEEKDREITRLKNMIPVKRTYTKRKTA